MRPRVIPALLVSGGGLVKTKGFANPEYVGDPVNTVRIFNDLEVDELIVLDINCTKERRDPDFDLLQEFASEAFFPLCYGGGVKSLATIEKIFSVGFEKVAMNQAFLSHPQLLEEAAKKFGSQSLVVSVDIKKGFWGSYAVYDYVTGRSLSRSIEQVVRTAIDSGAGEIIVNDVNSDGKMKGFDLSLVRQVSPICGQTPLISMGGAGCYEDLPGPINEGSHAVAAGSVFVYQNRMRGVLVNYPTQDQLAKLFAKEKVAI